MKPSIKFTFANKEYDKINNHMNCFRYFFLLTIFGLFIQSSRANLVLNPGFESSAANPQHWIITGPTSTMLPNVIVDSQVKYSGHFGLRISGTNPNCNGRVFQKVNVIGGQTYCFSAAFRSENVKAVNKSIVMKITWFNGKENIGYHYLYKENAGRDDWHLISQKIMALPGSTSVEISLEFRWSEGSVWWDDISIVETTADFSRNIKIATIYCRPPGKTVQDNILKMSELIDKAGTSNCNIVCLPEGWATYGTGLEMSKVEANTLTGSASAMLSRKSKQFGMYIVSGLYSWEGDTLFNTGVLFDKQGNRKAVYKKVHVPYSEIAQGTVPGDTIKVIDTDFGRIGILVCWDYAFPEPSRILALKGAEIIFCPIWGDLRSKDAWKLVPRSRAMDNGVYFVTSIYDGHSLIVNPAGEILQESDTNEVVLTETIDLNYSPHWEWIGNPGLGEWHSVWRKDRRPDAYKTLSDYESTQNKTIKK